MLSKGTQWCKKVKKIIEAHTLKSTKTSKNVYTYAWGVYYLILARVPIRMYSICVILT
jgi:hypothetical protein